MKRKFLAFGVVGVVVALVALGVVRDGAVATDERDPLPLQPFFPEATMTQGSGALDWGPADTVHSTFDVNVVYGSRLSMPMFYTPKGYRTTPDKETTHGTVSGSVTAETDILCDGVVDILGKAGAPPILPEDFNAQTVNMDPHPGLGDDEEDYVRWAGPPFEPLYRQRADLTTLYIGGDPAVAYPLIPPIPLNSTGYAIPWKPGASVTHIMLAGDPAPPSGVCQDSPQDSVSTIETDLLKNPASGDDNGGPQPVQSELHIDGLWVEDAITGARGMNIIELEEGTGWLVTVVKKKVLQPYEEAVAGWFHDVWVVEKPILYPPVAPSIQWQPQPGDICTDQGYMIGVFTGDGTGPCDVWIDGGGNVTDLHVQEYVIPGVQYDERDLVLDCEPGSDGTSYILAVKNIAMPKPYEGTVDNDLQNNVGMTVIRLDCGDVSGLDEVDKSIAMIRSFIGGEERHYLSLPEEGTEIITIDETNANHTPFAVDTEEWWDAETSVDIDYIKDLFLQWQPQPGDICTDQGIVIGLFTGEPEGPCDTWIAAGNPVTDLHFQELNPGTKDENGEPRETNQKDVVRDLQVTCPLGKVGTFPLVIKKVLAPKSPKELGDSGTAESGTANTLTDDDKTWTVDEWVGWRVKITAGTGAGQVREIKSNTSDTLTVTQDWDIAPDDTSEYEIYLKNAIETTLIDNAQYHVITVTCENLDSGTAESGTANTLTDTDKTWAVNEWQNAYVTITGGTGAGQLRQIASNTDTTVTVTQNWVTNPDNTSTYAIGPGDGTDDAAGLYARWTTFTSNEDWRRSYDKESDGDLADPPDTMKPHDVRYVERKVVLNCFYIGPGGTVNQNDWDNWPAGIDLDHDCLQNAATAQPGHAVDPDDTLNGQPCPPITYSGDSDHLVVQYDTAQDWDCDGLVDGIEAAWGSSPLQEDTDSDGASDFDEMFNYTNPLDPDSDDDGLLDKPDDDYEAQAAGGNESGEAVNEDDNCPNRYNPDQANNDGYGHSNGLLGGPTGVMGTFNGDTLGDVCDTDDDNDEIVDAAEYAYEDPNCPLQPDGRHHLDPFNIDTDGDHRADGQEYQLGKDPCVKDSPPAALTEDQCKLVRGGNNNVPADGYDCGKWDNELDGDEDSREEDPDDDHLEPIDNFNCVNITGSPLLKSTEGEEDDGDGPNWGYPGPEITDVVEVVGYNTLPAVPDSDGDNCPDWQEIADINGDGAANILDVQTSAQCNLGKSSAKGCGAIPPPAVIDDDSLYVADINKDGANNILDVQLTALNTLAKGGMPVCSSNQAGANHGQR